MWPEVLSVVNFVIVVLGLIGGYFGLKGAIARSESDIQTRVRDTLMAENTLLQNRVNRLEQERDRHNRLIDLLIVTVKKLYNVEIDIDFDGDIITFKTTNGLVVTRGEKQETKDFPTKNS